MTDYFNTLTDARCLIIAGHYGSGKTNVAVNAALELAKTRHVTIVDLDIVNPYFRTADAVPELNAAGVDTVIPEFANSNVDIPALPPEVNRLFIGGGISVVDVGGDEGAVALGMYNRDITRTGYAMLYVINMYRPLTAIPEDAADLMREIEACSRLKFTAVVNNSNLGVLTDADIVKASGEYAARVCELTGLPLAFTSIIRDRAPEYSGNVFFMSQATKQLF